SSAPLSKIGWILRRGGWAGSAERNTGSGRARGLALSEAGIRRAGAPRSRAGGEVRGHEVEQVLHGNGAAVVEVAGAVRSLGRAVVTADADHVGPAGGGGEGDRRRAGCASVVVAGDRPDEAACGEDFEDRVEAAAAGGDGHRAGGGGHQAVPHISGGGDELAQ